MVEHVSGEGESGVGSSPVCGVPDEILAGLSSAQRAAVTNPGAPLCVLAAAGAGKTRVLTRRIAYRCFIGAADPEHTLALTFTRKAASELQHRLAVLGLRPAVAAGTFHSTAAAALQRWWADRRQAPPTLLDRKGRLLGPIVEGRPGLGRMTVSDLASLIEWAKARSLRPGELADQVPPGRLPRGTDVEAVASVYARYEDEKRRRGLLDFDDMLLRCAEALETDSRFADAQRWIWRHIYVDEFQDLNPLQFRLLGAWLGESTDLCVVGDPNQAIYGWNGADTRIIEHVGTHWPSTVSVHLDQNHRCTEQIVSAAATVLGAPGARLRAAGRQGTRPTVERYGSEREEATGIAAAIISAQREGHRWKDMAVLTRTNSQLRVIGEALTAAGIPWWSAAATAVLDNPRVRSTLDEMGRRQAQPVAAAVADLAEVSETGEEMAALADLARAYLSVRPEGTIGDWLAWLPATTRERSDGTGGRDAVTLSSFHRAKGLEWPAVWVAGVEEGLVPMAGPGDGAAEAEERRLLYVAMTRAEAELHLSWAATRSFGGRGVPRQQSRWLYLVEGSHAAEAGRAPDQAEWVSRLSAQKRRLAGTAFPDRRRRALPQSWGPADEETRTALREWRLRAARTYGVPPHMVLHDATIEALAAMRPRSAEELISVPGLGPVKAGRYGADLLGLLDGRATA